MTTEDSEWAPKVTTLAECAEAWWLEQGRIVPDNSEEWDRMYEQWIEHAFGPDPEEI